MFIEMALARALVSVKRLSAARITAGEQTPSAQVTEGRERHTSRHCPDFYFRTTEFTNWKRRIHTPRPLVVASRHGGMWRHYRDSSI
jgi:hypothetical protein